MDLFFGKGDVTGDGNSDIYMRNGTTGELHLYPGNGSGGLGSPTLVGPGWQNYKHLVSVGEFNGDSHKDILAVSAIHITNAVSKTEAAAVTCGTTPSYPADLISINRTHYDGASGLDHPPMRGLSTKTVAVSAHNGTIETLTTSGETGYDSFGRPVWAKDALGNQTDIAYAHNSAGLLTSVTTTLPAATSGAARHVTAVTHDPMRGHPLTITDPNSKVTTGTYDRLGRLVSVRKPGNSGTHPDIEYSYSITKSAAPYIHTKVLGPNGNQISSYEIFDGMLRQRQSQTTAPDGKRTINDTRYDSRGLAAKQSVFYNNASGPASTMVWPAGADADIDRQTRFVYDGAGRKTFDQVYSLDVLKFDTETVYDGDRTGVIPPAGGIVTMDVFNARGKVVEKRQYVSATALTGTYAATLYGYNDSGQLTSVTDPASNTWTYKYNLLGHRYEVIDPDAGTSASTFDNAGKTLSSIDARGQQMHYEYDNLGRKTRVRADTAGTGTTRATWTFDTLAKGQLTSTSRIEGANTYTSAVGSYDDGYRPLSTTDTIPGFGTGGSTLTYTTTHTYNTIGAPATTTYPSVGGLSAETVTHHYLNTGLPHRLTSSYGAGTTYVDSTTYTYDGLVAEQLLGATNEHVKLANTYDPATRRLTVAEVFTETSPGTYTSKFTSEYGYRDSGLIVAIAGKTNNVRDQVECFEYDHLQRLTKAWTNSTWNCTAAAVAGGAGADPYWRQWTFDSIGNRLTQTDKGSTSDTVWTNQVGAAGSVKPHQIKQITSTGPLSGPTRTYTYDNNGNTLTQHNEAGTAQTLTWDKENHLATLTTGTTTTTYTYDSGGRRLISSTPAKQTLYLNDGTELEKIGSADPLATRYYAGTAMRDAAGLKWTCSNHQASTTIQIDSVTLTPNRRRFLPYGETRGAAATGWRGTKDYVGGTKDDTGLTHLGAREYDPTTGRFISIDPIMDLNDPTQWNPYGYANASPVTNSDPSGLVPDCGDMVACPTRTPSPPTPIPGCHGGNQSPTCAGSGYGSVAGTEGDADPGCMEVTPNGCPLTKTEQNQLDQLDAILNEYGSGREFCVFFGLICKTAESQRISDWEIAMCHKMGIGTCRAAHQAFEDAERLVGPPPNGDPFDPAWNARHHALWMALMVVRGVSANDARLLGVAHEIGGPKTGAPAFGSVDSRRDIRNNEAGIQIGLSMRRTRRGPGTARQPSGEAILARIDETIKAGGCLNGICLAL